MMSVGRTFRLGHIRFFINSDDVIYVAALDVDDNGGVVLNVGSLDDVVRAAMTVYPLCANFKLLVVSLFYKVLLSFFLSSREGRGGLGLIYIFRALRPNYAYYDVESLA